MSKLGLEIEKTYQRPGDRNADIRRAVLDSLHPPEKRATTNTLFLIGLVALAISVGGFLGLMR